MYGLVGSGRTELIRTILGVDYMDEGDVYVHGKKVRLKSLSESLHKYKIGYVTENRKEEGLFLQNSVQMNICMNSLDKFYKTEFHLSIIKQKRKMRGSMSKN